jgi:hypothetical protein
VIVITGGFLSATHVMVLAVVAVLPQASLAVNVLVCDALHEVVDIAASIAVIVVVLQPSVAVAEPSAASISEAEGLQPRVVVVSTGSDGWSVKITDPCNSSGSSSRVTTTIRSSKGSCL